MFFAPITEIYGRRNTFLAFYLLFDVVTLLQGFTFNMPGLIVLRFLTGVGSSTFGSVVGGILSDVFDDRDRVVPMAFFSTGNFIGAALGPMISEHGCFSATLDLGLYYSSMLQRGQFTVRCSSSS